MGSSSPLLASLRPATAAPRLALALVSLALFALVLLAQTSSSSQAYFNSTRDAVSSVRQSLAWGVKSVPARWESRVRHAIDSTASNSQLRLTQLNAKWNPERANLRGRYKLGSISLPTYQAEMQSNWTKLVDTTSARTALDPILRRILTRLELAASSEQQNEQPLTKTIWSTAKNGDKEVPQFRHWATHNEPEGWVVKKLDDDGLEGWMLATFGADSELTKRFMRLPLKVLQSDMFRYLVLLIEGGVWGDSDTTSVKPISRWGEGYVDGTDLALSAHTAHLSELWSLLDPSLPLTSTAASSPSSALPPPALIVAVELASSHAQYETPKPWWIEHTYVRQVQLTQWSLAAQPGHPVLWDVLSRGFAIQEEIERGEIERKEVGVLDWTGPGAFTDAVFRYLRARWGFDHERLVGMTKPLRVGDVLILPDRAFTAWASEPSETAANSPEACVWHGFSGRWKDQPWRRSKRELR